MSEGSRKPGPWPCLVPAETAGCLGFPSCFLVCNAGLFSKLGWEYSGHSVSVRSCFSSGASWGEAAPLLALGSWEAELGLSGSPGPRRGEQRALWVGSQGGQRPWGWEGMWPSGSLGCGLSLESSGGGGGARLQGASEPRVLSIFIPITFSKAGSASLAYSNTFIIISISC